MNMKRLLLVLLLFVVCSADRRIVSRPVQTNYNQYGGINQLILQFKSYNTIYSHQYIKITLPQLIHSTATNLHYSIKTSAQYSLVNNQLSQPLSSTIYYFKVSTQLQAQVWYKLSIQVQIQLSINYGIISMQIISDHLAVNPLKKAWNQGFEYYHIQNQAVPDFTILDIQLLTTTLSNKPAARYPIQIQIQSSVDINETTRIQIGFVDPLVDTTTISSLLSMQNSGNGFIFTGYCSALCDTSSGYQCIHLQKCINNERKLEVYFPYMTTATKYLIQAYIINPLYASSTRIEAYWKGNNEMSKAIDFTTNLLEVLQIAINAQQIKLLWGIPYDTVVTDMGLGLFVNDVSSTNPSLSSFDIGFSVTDYSPIQGQYEVRINVGADSVVQASINHNLPSTLSSTEIYCRYINPQIVCSGVDAFINKNYRYYVRAKGYFTTASIISQFGDVSIISQDYPTQTIFTPLIRGLTPVTIINSDYRDLSGIHTGASNLNIRETIVSSYPDTHLDNATSNSVKNMLFSGDSFVGIDPSMSPLQLNFYMNVDLTKMAKPSPSTSVQKYQMYVYANPNIMNVSDKGIDIQAYSQGTQEWDVENLPCYVDSSPVSTMQIFQCQKFDDHVLDIQKYNIYTSNQYYHQYQWICGDAGVGEVECSTSDCSLDCNIFRGNFNTDPSLIGNNEGGIMSIRNVTFKDDFHASPLASDNDLDFVIAFYQDGDFVSASLINGYTLNSTRLENLKAEMINHYNYNNIKNEGDRVPTLLKFSGKFTLSQIGNLPISSIQIYLPKTLTITNFVERNNFNTYGCSTKNCKGYLGGLSTSDDVWIQQQMIEIKDLPALASNFHILLPVVWNILEPIRGITIQLKNIAGLTRGVFRINGSSVMQPLENSPNFITDVWIPTVQWDPTQPQWVQDSSYTYKQSISLQNMQLYQDSIDVSMGVTLMLTPDTNPSSTFSIAYTNIFSKFSTIEISNGGQCVGPFNYTFLDSYPLWTFWCPLVDDSLNQIIINFPLYQNFLGSGFPFDIAIAYQYSNSEGQMIGYRVQQDIDYTPQQCSTIKQTEYYLEVAASQQSTFTIYLPAIQLNPLIRNSLKITVGYPSSIGLLYKSCIAQQLSSRVQLACSYDSQSGSDISVILTNSLHYAIKLNEIELTVKTQKNGAATTTDTPQYTIKLFSPMTDSGTSSSSIYGDSFSSYESLFAQCSNSFSYSTQTSTQFTQLSDPELFIQSSEFYGNLKFKIDFGDYRITFFQGSQLILTFSDTILTDLTRCWFQPQKGFWSQYSIDAGYQIITLIASKDLNQFTIVTYEVICSNIMTTGSTFTMTADWYQSGTVVQTGLNSLTFDHSQINSVTNTGTATLQDKLYNTKNFISEYHFNYTLSITQNDNIKVRIIFPFANIHKNLLECQFYSASNWIPILCYSEVVNSVQQVYIEFIGSTTSQVNIKVYGIPQGIDSPPTIKSLITKTTMTTLTEEYYVFDISDLSPNVITNQPIIVSQITIDESSIISIQYSFPVIYSSDFYVELDELFLLPYTFQISTDFICTINGNDVTCTKQRANLLKITSTQTHLSGGLNQLKIGPLPLTNKQQYDEQHIYFRLFTVSSSSANYVSRGTHHHLQSALQKASIIQQRDNLQWIIHDSQLMCQYVYVGYYGPPPKISTKLNNPLLQSINETVISPSTHSLAFDNLQLQLGLEVQTVFIGAKDQSILGFLYLEFNHQSTIYDQLQSLPIYVSTQKCILTSEYDEYNIFKQGQTIPIVVNISQCKPIYPMSVDVSIDTTYIVQKTTLTTQIIDSNSQAIYIVLQHPQNIDATLNQDYQLTILLNSNNSYTNSAYQAIPIVTIHVISKSNVIGNPEGKQAEINQIGSQYISLTLQCNSPSTIYWGIGLYPVMLGINTQQIQARLIQQGNGLLTQVNDIYSWSREIYGTTYSRNFDGQVDLVIDGLQSGKQHVFKYFCVDQSGTSSDGKITQFTTSSSNYSLIKVTLSFQNQLQHHDVDNIACSISETLMIPYNQTISSTFSNCINTSTVYYDSDEYMYDQIINENIRGSTQYNYFFYIDSKRVSRSFIISQLMGYLGTHSLFIDGSVQYFSDIRIDQLLNAYQPKVINYQLSVQTNKFELEIDTGSKNVYLIVGFMGKHFDAKSMSLPTHYMMKQGYFSENTRFDQIYPIYGRQKLSVKYQNLSEGSQYSVFYLLTVDNSALNARHTEVYNLDITTGTTVLIDLSGSNLNAILLLSILILIIVQL